MSTPEQIYELVKTLPIAQAKEVLAQAKEVLDFAESLQMKTQLTATRAEWDSIADDTDYPELTDAKKQEFDRRIAEHDAEPDNVLTWEELKASIKRPR